MTKDKQFEKSFLARSKDLNLTSDNTETNSLLCRSGITQPPVKLTRGECFLAAFFLMSWLLLFAGGIVMDTTKFRCAISPDGAKQLAAEAKPGEAITVESVCGGKDLWVPAALKGISGSYKLTVSWVGLILFFLPLNLAMVSAAAGALGALGNRANLEDEKTVVTSRDDSNPIMSGLLRGLFVYLFFISGLLLFDDKPFSSPGPGQYIRLAGFISLFSFLINYRPNLFSTISDWAFERINYRKIDMAAAATRTNIRVNEAGAIDKIELDTAVGTTSTNGHGKSDLTSAPETIGVRE